jgi:hypothetical protein
MSSSEGTFSMIARVTAAAVWRPREFARPGPRSVVPDNRLAEIQVTVPKPAAARSGLSPRSSA